MGFQHVSTMLLLVQDFAAPSGPISTVGIEPMVVAGFSQLVATGIGQLIEELSLIALVITIIRLVTIL